MNTRPTPLADAPRGLAADDFAPPPAIAAEPVASPLAGILRLMRGRWLLLAGTAAVLSPALAVTGYMTGTPATNGATSSAPSVRHAGPLPA
jgi:hypothetical protein